ncbi:MAG TPA: hypothetical protein VJM09_07360 [Sphingobium sp.]|nr:hypothetical protein [Sphingobium sp.]
MRGGLCSILMVLAITAGCRDTSGESAAAADESSPPLAAADNAAELALPPIEVVAAQPRPSAEVTVRAQPAPLGSLDLPPSPDAAQSTAFPQEVTSFMVDRDGCDHFRGEEPYDSDRRAYLAENIAELCTGTDARLSMLRRRYAGNPAVIAALRGYEDRIEAYGPY